MSTVAVVLLLVLLGVPLIVVGTPFVWAARKDGAYDRALPRRRRSPRRGR